MKKLLLLMLCLVFMLTSCVKITIIMPGDNKGTSSNKNENENNSVTDPIFGNEDEWYTEDENPSYQGSDTSVDYDYSELSNIEQYDKVLEFVLFFDNYLGKTVKLHGQYTKGEYHVFTVADNLNCCYAPFEIITRDGNYPANEDWVIVKGVLRYLEEDGEKYPYIDVYEVIPSEDRN